MHDKALHTYIDDHLTGANTVMSVVAARIERVGDDGWLRGFHAELQDEAAQLHVLLGTLVANRIPHRALGLAAATAAQLKLAVDGRVHEPLRALLEYELIVTGVSGKRCLWFSLGELSHDPRVATLDVPMLVSQADRQIAQAEPHRRRHAAALG